jgi:GntR family transcriptional regulator, rspAB operon transcriptional repressor
LLFGSKAVLLPPMLNMALDGSSSGPDPGAEESLAARVAGALRDEIVKGALEPGERIKQDAVAQRLEVSRLPVREALRELESEGLVLLERDVGARVAPLERANLLEIFLVRETLEPVLVAEAVRKIDEPQLDFARALNEKAEQFANEGRVDDYVSFDPEFHDAIFVAAEMPRVHAIVKGHRNAAARYRHAYSHLARISISVAEHRMILEAVARRQAEDAAELHRIHIRRTRITIAEHPGGAVPSTDPQTKEA